jgi:hypothetical protein
MYVDADCLASLDKRLEAEREARGRGQKLYVLGPQAVLGVAINAGQSEKDIKGEDEYGEEEVDEDKDEDEQEDN